MNDGATLLSAILPADNTVDLEPAKDTPRTNEDTLITDTAGI